MGSGVRRIIVSIEPAFMNEFDETISEMGYNRSPAMRDFLADYKWSVAEKGTVAGAVTMIYDHHVR